MKLQCDSYLKHVLKQVLKVKISDNYNIIKLNFFLFAT